MPGAEQFAEVIGKHGIGNDNEVIVYSVGGMANAARLFLMFRAMGHDTVRLLNGGWEKWVREGRPLSTEKPGHAPVFYRASARSGKFLDKDMMRQAVGDERACVVMALPSAIYRGEKQMFRRPGRIPGSISIPASDLIDAEVGTFLPADRLEQKLAPVLSADRAITYCGAGMTAAVNGFALELVGYEQAAIYDGSMLEWADDESLPMEPAV
jgi:thiosulfate/3-mercaptopyruvate sulfurtransferase